MAKFTVYGLPGVYNATPLSLNDGDGVALAVTSAGELIVVNSDGSNVGGGTEYIDAGTPPAHPHGPTLIWNNSGTWEAVSTAQPLPVSISASEITIGAVNVLDTTDTEINPAKEDGNLLSIKTNTDKIPALGQALAAGSVPVVLTAAQQSALTPPSNTGYALDSSLTTIDTDIKSNITLHAGTNVIGHVIVDSGSVTVNTISGFALESGGNLDAIETDIDILVANSPVLGQAVMAASTPVVIASDQTSLPVIGTLTNNNAQPSSNNVGALMSLANAKQQTWTEGDLVLQSTDLKGNARTRISDAAGNDRGANVDANNRLSVQNDSFTSYARLEQIGSLDYIAQLQALIDPLPTGNNLIGKVLAKKTLEQDMVRGNATSTSNAAVVVIPADSTGQRLYITSIQISNTGPTTSLITFTDGASGAILGYTIAPAGGGSNPVYLDGALITSPSQGFYFTPASASTTIYCSAQGYRLPY